jgi:hypothetical protein
MRICFRLILYVISDAKDTAALSACTLKTTCIASTDMSRLCTDDPCTSNDAVAKCTQGGSSECYRWLFDYGTTTMVRGNLLPVDKELPPNTYEDF